MRRFTNLLCACIVFLVYSCNDEAANAGMQNDTVALTTDTIDYAVNTDSINRAYKAPQIPQGIYQTMLPCADCRGIEHTVYFNPDMTYRLEEARLTDKSRNITYTKGIWKLNDGLIWAYKDSSVKARYTWQGNTLQYIDPRTENKVPMRELPTVLDNETWQQKKLQGATFFGTGTEPFWSVEIDDKKGISFQLADRKQPVKFKPAKPLNTTDSLAYQTASDTATLRIVIYNIFCRDGMSDNVYNNKVTLQYNGTTYNGCGLLYKGL